MRSFSQNISYECQKLMVLPFIALAACTHAQPSVRPVPPPTIPATVSTIQSSAANNVLASKPAPQASALFASSNSATAVIEGEKMVENMMKKIRRFLTEKPQTAEEIMALFELQESKREVNRTNDNYIFANGKFPYSQTEYNDWNAQIGFDANQKLYMFSFDLYKPNAPRPKGAPWCFPIKPLIKLLAELNFQPRQFDNQKIFWISYLRLAGSSSYEEVTFHETENAGACFVSFGYKPIASLNHIKM